MASLAFLKWRALRRGAGRPLQLTVLVFGLLGVPHSYARPAGGAVEAPMPATSAASAASAPPILVKPYPASVEKPQTLPRSVTHASSARHDEPFQSHLSRHQLARARASGGDTARLLQDIPGVSLYGAGGVSSLPVIQGLADDRLRTQVDGMDLVAACPNHMNPALSYIDPSNVGSVKVYAGISPVSSGGDSIGGSIQIEAAAPEFAAEGAPALRKGTLSSFYRSSGLSRGANASATLATHAWNMAFTDARSQQSNYRAAAGFKPVAAGSEAGRLIPADEVGSSAYRTSNQELRLAWRQDQHLVQLSFARQKVGFEGFPNQRMDMTDNRSTQSNLRYTGQFDWGQLKARLWQQEVKHAMDMGPDRYFYGFGMPMLTEATTRGMQLQTEVDVNDLHMLRMGVERQTYVLYDWWPPVGGSMGPNAFWNVDNGQRIRDGAYAEWQADWSPQWSMLSGARVDRIVTDADKVQGYDNGLGAIWGKDAADFNASSRHRKDELLDLAMTLRYQPHLSAGYELGVARKAHAPNLYQRYAWSTQPMAALMNNFMGDGNGYIGNLSLRPEVARKLALTGAWQDGEDGTWQLKVTLHASHVDDFIDAKRCDFGQCSSANVSAVESFVLLQYTNVPARLYGMDLSGRKRLLMSETAGELNGWFVLSHVRGRNLASGDDLYNIMPDNIRLALEHKVGGFTASLELLAVAAKRRVSKVRNEITTPGYGLAHLRASYEWRHARLDLGLENVFNRLYFPPLGGAYLGQGRSMTSAGIPWGTAVPGPGRSINISLSLWL